MELPIDIWCLILEKTRTIVNCEKLYRALPKKTRKEIEFIYFSHKKKLNLRMIIGFENNICLFNNDKLEKSIKINNNIFVKYVKNWRVSDEEKDLIVIASHQGIVYFLDKNTLYLVNRVDIGTNLSQIEFHPIKSIMITVSAETHGQKLKIWRFDTDNSLFTIPIEFLGSSKKLFFFNPIEPEIYIFTSNYSYNPYHWKLEKVYFCNYENQSIGFSDAIHNYFYLNNIYTPLEIREDGTFDCIKYENSKNNFCNFKFNNNEILEIKNNPVLLNEKIKNSLIVWNFIRNGDDIYYQNYEKGNIIIYRQRGDKYKIIYRSIHKLSKMICKNEYLIFTENKELKFLNIKDDLIDSIFLDDFIIDFCIL